MEHIAVHFDLDLLVEAAIELGSWSSPVVA